MNTAKHKIEVSRIYMKKYLFYKSIEPGFLLAIILFLVAD